MTFQHEAMLATGLFALGCLLIGCRRVPRQTRLVGFHQGPARYYIAHWTKSVGEAHRNPPRAERIAQ